MAQGCPPNIDFEQGSLDGWTCYIGTTSAAGGQNTINLSPSAPIPGRHTLISSGFNSQLDPYGSFPVNCPNGSGHSIRLGNDLGGGEAEGISYVFTVPANQNTYSLIYHYAVVFEGPNHLENEQPRMVIEIENLTDNKRIDCSSFSFIPFGTVLPGFFISPMQAGDAPVWCKNWTAVSINLNNMAGKQIRLFFKTADCTFRRHFGYAYVDVDSECSGEFVGATYCVVAPFGYQNYIWFNSNFSQVLGNAQVLTFNPPPPVGQTIAVELVPYNGYGCKDTLYARLVDTLTVRSFAGADATYCLDPVQIGGPPRAGFSYRWSPAAGLSDPNIANPYASPNTTTNYVLTTRSAGGGCATNDTVQVFSRAVDTSLQVLGKVEYCQGSGDSTILIVRSTDSIQWYRDNLPIPGATGQRLRVVRSGTYSAQMFNSFGCGRGTRSIRVVIEPPRPGIRYPDRYAIADLPLELQARDFGLTTAWTPATSLSSAAIARPVFTGRNDQQYQITLTTRAGCVTVDTLLVRVVPKVEIYVPSAFTPNKDGLNDLLLPTGMGLKELRYFRVYNRWGQLLFQTTAEGTGWDGRINGVEVPSQVVVWSVEGLGLDGQTHQRKGTAMLIR